MARRRATVTIDPFADLAKKIEILEREMAIQRAALDRLKEMGSTQTSRPEPAGSSVRKTA